MYGMDFQEEMANERMRGYAQEADDMRLSRLVAEREPTLRARLARRLFGIAVKLERNATWDAVWEKMEAPKRS